MIYFKISEKNIRIYAFYNKPLSFVYNGNYLKTRRYANEHNRKNNPSGKENRKKEKVKSKYFRNRIKKRKKQYGIV